MFPKRLDDPVPPPESLSERSAALWRAIVGDMAVSEGRAELLEQGLLTLDRLRQIQSELAKSPLTTVTPKSGAVHLNPLAKLESEVRRQFVGLWATLKLEQNLDIDGIR